MSAGALCFVKHLIGLKRQMAQNAQPSDLMVNFEPGPLRQVLRHTGAPRSIAKFDVRTLIQMARDADALIELDCAVGDTIVYDTQLLQSSWRFATHTRAGIA